jgi:hypothetical protein
MSSTKFSLFDSVVSMTMATDNDLDNQKSIDGAVEQLLYLLDDSVQLQNINAPLPRSNSQSDAYDAILYSGGIDSVI